MTSCPCDIHAILSAHSMCVHFITLKNNIFHNHLTQGIVALHRLGAPKDIIERFIKNNDELGGGMYGAKEKGYDQLKQEVISESRAAELLGKSECYYDLLTYYQHKLKNQYGGSLEQFVKGEMKKLDIGVMGELTHAIIEIGHGYCVGETGMVIEGMAWLHHGFAPPCLPRDSLTAPFKPGPMSLKEMLTKLQNDERLKKIVYEAHKNGHQGLLSVASRLEAVWGPEAGTLLDYLNQTNLELPSDPEGMGDRLVDIAILVYITNEKRNEFFILHGLTGAWSIRQILPLLDPESARVITRTFLMIILCIYVMEGSYPLVFSHVPPPGQDLPVEWSELAARAVAYESPDPHVYKIVQVCHDMAKRGPKEKQGFYKAGALVALENEIVAFSGKKFE